jgi:hypothetical protein
LQPGQEAFPNPWLQLRPGGLPNEASGRQTLPQRREEGRSCHKSSGVSHPGPDEALFRLHALLGNTLAWSITCVRRWPHPASILVPASCFVYPWRKAGASRYSPGKRPVSPEERRSTARWRTIPDPKKMPDVADSQVPPIPSSIQTTGTAHSPPSSWIYMGLPVRGLQAGTVR